MATFPNYVECDSFIGPEYNPFVIKGMLGLGEEVIAHQKYPTPELLLRYESNIERQISRTIDQLERWRMMRPNNSEPPAEPEEQTGGQ